jgi:KUP system potassium uptake protein
VSTNLISAAEPAPVGVDQTTSGHAAHGGDGLPKLALGAIGVVFGDIGTSPLYAFRETFAGHHKLDVDAFHIMGVVSLIFWSMLLVVTIQYVTIIMRADNKGEGGSLALLALISGRVKQIRWSRGLVLLGVFATALFYGDSMITPAVTVLGAVEGLAVAQPSLSHLVLPLSAIIIVALFVIQSKGTAKIGLFFGPVMLLYFVVIAALGVMSIVKTPGVLWSLSPHYAVLFFVHDPVRAFLALGSVVLAVTGAEALYADMGHFGRRPIRVSWMFFVLPALMLNYMGQGALLFRDGVSALESPFYKLAPAGWELPLVLIATAAAMIASQAVISGAFSVTQQAIQLGFMPRLRIEHTNARVRSTSRSSTGC